MSELQLVLPLLAVHVLDHLRLGGYGRRSLPSPGTQTASPLDLLEAVLRVDAVAAGRFRS